MFRLRLFQWAALSFTLCGAVASLAQDKSAGPATTQPANFQIKSGNLSISNGDAKVPAYFARPVTQTPVPAVLLIHEWWGLNDWVKQQADRFARRGYAALTVDLYRGETAEDADHAHELMRGLPDERAMGDMKAAFAYLAMQEAVKGEKIGAIGWCMGGSFALKLAIAEPRLDAVVMCYGRTVTDVNQLKQIKCPLLGIWGETDRGIEVEPFRKALKEARIEAEHHIHPGAGHAFMNENNKRGYNREQAARAWTEIDRFLDKNLKRQPVGEQAEQKST